MEKSADDKKRAEDLAHVRNVIRTVDPNGRFLEAGESLAKVIDNDSRAAEAFRTIVGRASITLDENAKRIYESYLVLYKRALRRQGDFDPEPFGGPDGAADLLSVGYLYAIDLLRAPGAADKLTFDKLRAQLPEVANHIGSVVDGEFLARLLLEAKTRAQRDPAFARAIENGKTDLAGALPQLTLPTIIAQQAGGGGSLCSALFPSLSSRGCWVVGLICTIVVVVVPKLDK